MINDIDLELEEFKQKEIVDTPTPIIETQEGLQDDIDEIDNSVHISNFTVDKEFTSKIPDKEVTTDKDYIGIPSVNRLEFSNRIKNEEYLKSIEGKEETVWYNTIKSGLSNSDKNSKDKDNILLKATNRSTAKWTQGIQFGDIDLSIGVPKLPVKKDVKYTKEQLTLRICKSLNMGTVITIPLWHSGIWISLRTPSEGALLELYRQISSDKLILGRSTYGLIYSNYSVYTTKALMDFVVNNIYSHTVLNVDNEKIIDYIKVTDLDILVYGLACATWPNGFNYRRACVIEPDVCNHVITEKMNLSKLHYTDCTSLTDRQIKHMTIRKKEMTVDSLKMYALEMTRGNPKVITINERTSFTLEIPTISEHIESGVKWISDIEYNYTDAMLKDIDNRNTVLLAQGKATRLRHYGHFIKSMDFDEVTYSKDKSDKEDLDTILNILSENNEISKKLIDSSMDYMGDSKLSIVAIPTYKCPNCGKEETTYKDGHIFSSLIALDTMNVFFALLRLKMIEMENQEDM